MKPHMILTYDIDARAAYIYLRPGDMEFNHARGYTENESDSGGGTDILLTLEKTVSLMVSKYYFPKLFLVEIT